MSLFLKEPWIERTCCSQLQSGITRTSLDRYPNVPSHAQLIEVVKENEDGSFEVCISDSRYFIIGILMNKTIKEFYEVIDCEIKDIKGCHIIIDKFHYDFSHEHGKFLIYIEKFTYCGGECDMYGNPADVNCISFMQDLLKSPLYSPFSKEDVVIHRSAIDAIPAMNDKSSPLWRFIDESQCLCGGLCRVCERNFNEGGTTISNNGIEKNCLENSINSADKTFFKTEKYNPIVEAFSVQKMAAQHLHSGGKNTKQIHTSEDAYTEEKRGADMDKISLQKKILRPEQDEIVRLRRENKCKREDFLNVCSDSDE